MDFVANSASRPLLPVEVDQDLRAAAFGAATAATGKAVRDVSAVLNDVEGTSVRTNDTLPIQRHISSAAVL